MTIFNRIPNPFKLHPIFQVLLFGLGICAILAANRVCEDKASDKTETEKRGALGVSSVLEYKE